VTIESDTSRLKMYCLKQHSLELGSSLQAAETPSLYGYTIIIDFITGLPKSKDGFDALLSATDKFTKSEVGHHHSLSYKHQS
jgi:hypothetical protein